MDKNPKIQEAIALLGGVVATAEKLKLDNYQTAQQWARANSIPAWYCKDIERLLDGAITCQELRPKDWKRYWPELAEAA